MEALKRRRTVLRSAFTRTANQFEEVLNADDIDLVEAETFDKLLQGKSDILKACDEEIFNLMLEEDKQEDELTAELNSCDEYTVRCTRLRVRYEKLNVKSSEKSVNCSVGGNCENPIQKRKFKLPQIDLIKFGGDIREWLTFWSQFKKIDEDKDLTPEDKFQYLLLAIIPNTRARDLIESFPPTAENYAKAVESLKSRFGRQDLLVEVYVRELLKLVLNNVSNQSKLGFSTLYDKIETQLRALETLGITTDTCTAMLYPLVESCLPEELLRVWQRSTEFVEKPEDPVKNRLSRLMKFLKAEVEGKERISLAVEGFGLTSDNKQKRSRLKTGEQSVPTATGLMNNNPVIKCVFCEGNHSAEKCFKAQKLSFDEKKGILANKKSCFRCARPGHRSGKCRERLRCVLCSGQHIVVLCPDLSAKMCKETPMSGNIKNTSDVKTDIKTETVLANNTDTRVFLQTLIVKIRGENCEREVRAIIDTGSQRSYVLKQVARELRYQSKHNETIIHALFGGAQTSEQQHACYDVRLVSLDGQFACKFEVMDQTAICSDVPSISNGIWTQELQEANIYLTDTKGRQPISILIGADIAGKIITGKKLMLQCGLVAMETRLGWVLMGKIPNPQKSYSNTMLVTSLLNREVSIEALWKLDVLGITDPGERKSRAELETAAKQLFEQTISVTDEGRYEVTLPWLVEHPPLPSNYTLANARLRSTEEKLKSSNYWKKYDEVFTEWIKDGVIEEVPKEQLDRSSHYLPHRPVIKEASLTTKIRPVFDASAKERGKPALNDCLEKGANLLERIPVILLRFRKEQIGVTSDIKGAFLQISLSSKDRDFLRFIWKTEDGVERILRHRRVVFGVNSSPFLLGATIEHHLNKCLKECENSDSVYSKQTIERLLKGFYVDNCVTSVSNMEKLEVFMQEATGLMAEAQFELRGWEFTDERNQENETSPLLGLQWNKRDDTLSISCITCNPGETVTKRVILSCAQRIFDPIGFTCPATLCPKILLQEMWAGKIGWDAEVNEEIRRKFENWRSELTFLSTIKIPRWVNAGLTKEHNLTLHVFCDASKVAYAAVVFLRAEIKNAVRIHLIQAKARITTIDKMSTPRLELMAATIGARLGAQIKEELSPDVKVFYWSDSTTTLSWIQNTEEWSTFVWNRVHEIRSLTQNDTWKHVPGEDNPADLPSRGCSPKQLAESKWWERLVGLMKQLLRKVLGRARLNEEELYTVLCDCESVINSRPLTYVSNEVEELVPLTPVMFLRELVESGVPDCDLTDVLSLNKRLRYLKRIRDDLRKRFRSEYLGQLRQTIHTKNVRKIIVGEIVLIGNDHSKRLDWPLGKVIEVFPAKDGKVRLARVQTQHGQLLRPVQRLYPLECIQIDTITEPRQLPLTTNGEESPEVRVAAPPILDEHRCVVNSVDSGSERVSRYGRKIKMPERYS